MTPTTLYRLYAADGRLLYIGIAKNWASRMTQHASEKAWFAEVARTTFQGYPNRQEALDAEREAIQREHPIHNVVHNDRSTTITSTGQIAWICESCDQLISPGEGAIAVNEMDVRRTERDVADARSRADEAGAVLTRLDLAQIPPRVHWHVLHYRCWSCDLSEESSYEIDTARCRTHAELLDWTAHLMSKVWLPVTDWNKLLHAVLDPHRLTRWKKRNAS